MCLLGRLRDMKQMYQSHGVTSPKTWHVSTPVRNGTSSVCSLNEILYNRLSSQCFAFFRTVRRFHLFPSPYILYTVRFLQNLHQQNTILFPAVAIVFSGTSTPTEFSECCSINLSSSCSFFYNSLSTWWKESNNLTDQGCEIFLERRMP